MMDPVNPANTVTDDQVAAELAASWPADLPTSAPETEPEAAAEGDIPAPGRTPAVAEETPEDFETVLPTDSPDVAEFKKNLQRGFSRKMNALQKKLDDLEKKGGGSGEEARKAQAFELLMQSDDPAAAVEALKKLQGSPQAQTQNALQQIVRTVPPKLAEQYKPEHLESLTGLVMHVIEQGLIPSLRPYQQFIEKFAQTQQTSEWDTLSKNYPTAAKYREQAERIAREKGLTAEQALLVASNGQILLEKQRHAQEEKRTNGVQPRIPATTQRQTVPIPNGTSVNDEDVAAELFEIDRKSGKPRYFGNQFFK